MTPVPAGRLPAGRLDGSEFRPARIAILDYGMGNRRSVEKALEHVGARPLLTSDHHELRRADGLILPGVGAFPEAMLRLGRAGLDELIIERVGAGVPTLGLCLGMQLAFDGSSEHGGGPGLGLVPGVVRALRSGDLKVPHIGWSPVRWRTRPPSGPDSAVPASASRCASADTGLLLREGLPEGSAFYHVHGYVAEPSDPADWLGTAQYGERFVTAVARGSFWGVQFHPEKSSSRGLRLLANFAALCAAKAQPPSARATERPGQADHASHAGQAGQADHEPMEAGFSGRRGGAPAA